MLGWFSTRISGWGTHVCMPPYTKPSSQAVEVMVVVAKDETKRERRPGAADAEGDAAGAGKA